MEIVHTSGELRARADAERAAGRRIALVPTMGALHAGHLSLVEHARERADVVWVSIFVNPTQFEEGADFDRYPRTLDDDARLCEEAGVDVIYAPAVEDLYPPGAQSFVEVEGLADSLCGASRPGHFRGVTTVVSKLFLAAKPHVAVFGQKDFQQLAVIRRMVRDLGFDVEVFGAPTVREPDGLALSSRNVHLGPVARREALALIRALDGAEKAVADGERNSEHILEGVRRSLGEAALGEIDYAELRDPDQLETAGPEISGPTLLALAVRFRPDPDGQGAPVRLIDNCVLRPEASSGPPEDPTR